MSSKQDIISSIYYDRSGYGSRATTLKDAREKDATITKEDVEEFFRKNVEEKRKPRGENSFVAHTPILNIRWIYSLLVKMI